MIDIHTHLYKNFHQGFLPRRYKYTRKFFAASDVSHLYVQYFFHILLPTCSDTVFAILAGSGLGLFTLRTRDQPMSVGSGSLVGRPVAVGTIAMAMVVSVAVAVAVTMSRTKSA